MQYMAFIEIDLTFWSSDASSTTLVSVIEEIMLKAKNPGLLDDISINKKGKNIYFRIKIIWAHKYINKMKQYI